MTRVRTITLAVAACGLAALALPAQAANLVTNGSFETGNFSGWTQTGDTSFTGVFLGPANGRSPTDGNDQATFGEVQDVGTLSQDIATIAGAQYTVSFDLTNIQYQDNFFSAHFAGQTLVTLTDIGSTPYTHYSYLVQAAGAVSTLALDTYNGPGGWQLDNVVVDGPPGIALDTSGGVPEPATWAMLIVGAFGAGAVLRRQRQALAA